MAGQRIVAICLATYNGDRYLEEQLLSILAQTYENWHLYIRDDDSTDKTQSIIDTFCRLYPNKITQVFDDETAHSALRNFNVLHRYVKRTYRYDYLMYCDQDDVWLSDKIEVSLAVMQQIESTYDGPVLVHTDLIVADNDLSVIDNSFWRYRSLRPEYNDLEHLLVYNNAVGCTVLINRKLDRLIKPNDGAYMHDWWAALVAASFGRIVFITQPTVVYRRHCGNVTDTPQINTLHYLLSRLTRLDKVRNSFNDSYKQAIAFHMAYECELPERSRVIVYNYIDALGCPFLSKRIKLLHGRYLRQGFIQIIGELLFI